MRRNETQSHRRRPVTIGLLAALTVLLGSAMWGVTGDCDTTLSGFKLCTGKDNVTTGSCSGTCPVTTDPPGTGQCFGNKQQTMYIGCNVCKGTNNSQDKCGSWLTPVACASADCKTKQRMQVCRCMPNTNLGSCDTDPGAWGNWPSGDGDDCDQCNDCT
jgi:hypothetical protein